MPVGIFRHALGMWTTALHFGLISIIWSYSQN